MKTGETFEEDNEVDGIRYHVFSSKIEYLILNI